MEKNDEINKEYWEVDVKRGGKIEEEDIVVCPYCYTPRPLYIDEFNAQEWEEEEICTVCGKTYKVEGEVRYGYWATTKRMEE